MAEESANGKRMELWKQVVATVGAIVVAGIGAWQAIKLTAPEPGPRISADTLAGPAVAPEFVPDFVFDTSDLELAEFEIDADYRLPGSNQEFARLRRVEYGSLADGSRAFSFRFVLRNVSDRPIQLDLDDRFFSLQDDQGRRAELVYFCCRASGELLGVKEDRQIHLIYRSVPGWEGKELRAERITFRVTGLLPLLRAVWWFRPLATAA